MGARGPLKLVSPLRPLAGATQGTAAADVSPLAPSKPSAVDGNKDLSALWDEVVPELSRAGLLTPSDAPAVELCLRHFLAARKASDDLAAGGSTLRDEKNGRDMKNPAEVVFRSESLAFLEFAKQLGMTFVARMRTPSAQSGGGVDENPFAASGS